MARKKTTNELANAVATLTGDLPSETGAQPPEDSEAIALVTKMMSIPGASGSEGQIARFIESQLVAAGAQPQWLKYDTAHRRTKLAGEVGNLCLKIPGRLRGGRRLLMAHMDTVPICLGCQPQRQGTLIRSADPRTGLGADDRAGAAVVLLTALRVLRRAQAHPPLTFLWTVQEEIGLQGARHLRPALLGQPALAFNWDGGAADKITLGATGGYRMQITIEGLASHAGNAPEKGVSAIAIASLAIADLAQRGWHGAISENGIAPAVGKPQRKRAGSVGVDVKRGTSNIGFIQGGTATNVVADRVVLRAEARSHDPDFRGRIVSEFEQAFARAASQVRSSDGTCGKVTIDGHLDYEAFQLPEQNGAVQAAIAAIRQEGLDPVTSVTNGGLDANWMFVHGIPTVTLGCGQLHPHTVAEALDLVQFQRACRIAWRLATSTDNAVQDRSNSPQRVGVSRRATVGETT